MAELSLKDKTAKGLFWGGISNGLQQILSLVFGIILLRVLDAKDYGMVGMLAIFMGIASTIQESGFTAALINKKEFKDEDYNAVFWFSVLSSVVMYIVLFFLAPFIAYFYNKPALTNLSRLLFLGFLFGGIGIAHNAILVKRLMVKERAQIDVLSLFVSGLIGIFLALNGFAYWGLAIQSVVYMGVGTFLKCYFSPWSPSLVINFIPLKDMFSFSIKLFVTNIFVQINNNIFSVLLGKFYNEKQVGYYTQGNKWMSMGCAVVGGMINSVAQPVLTQMREDVGRQCNALRKMLRFGAFVSFPFMLGLAFIGEEFLYIAGGEKWLPSVPFLQLFCIWGAMYYVWNLYVNVLMAHEKSNVYLWGMVSMGILQLIAIVLMFPLGILAMVMAYISCFFLALLFWHYFINKLIGLRLIDVIFDISPYLGATIFSFVVAWFTTKDVDNVVILLVLKVIISFFMYVLIMWLTKSVIFLESVDFVVKKINKK